MRKVILNLAVSLDGFIEGPDGEYDWCLTDQDYGMEAFYEEADTIFIGRKSYELIGADPSIFAGKKLYVFSDTIPAINYEDVQVIHSSDFDEKVSCILNEPGINIYLFGGATLLSTFIKKNLLNGLVLSIHPVILGGGKPLFKNITEKLDLILTDHKVYPSGLLQATYTMKPKFDMEMLKLL